jgi:hypothetical protein
MNLDNLSEYEELDIFTFVESHEHMEGAKHNWHFTLTIPKHCCKYLARDVRTLTDVIGATCDVHVVNRCFLEVTVVVDMYGVTAFQARQIIETVHKYEREEQ